MQVLAIFGPTGGRQDRRRDRARRAAARARRGPGRGLLRRDPGLPRARGPERRRERRRARAAGAPAARLRRTRRGVQRRALRRARARGDRRPARRGTAPDRGRRHRPLPARRPGRPRPAPAGAAPRSAREVEREIDERGPEALHAELDPDARRGRASATTASGSPAGPSSSAPGSIRRPRQRASCGPTELRHPTAAGRPDDGPRRAERGASTRGSSAMVAAGAARR